MMIRTLVFLLLSAAISETAPQSTSQESDALTVREPYSLEAATANLERILGDAGHRLPEKRTNPMELGFDDLVGDQPPSSAPSPSPGKTPPAPVSPPPPAQPPVPPPATPPSAPPPGPSPFKPRGPRPFIVRPTDLERYREGLEQLRTWTEDQRIKGILTPNSYSDLIEEYRRRMSLYRDADSIVRERNP